MSKFISEFNELYETGKYLKPFKETTPKGNLIKGVICTKTNHLLGSLHITNVNGERVSQYVHGFPKIHYHDEHHDFEEIIEVYEKLDGTNITVYCLKNKEDETIEFVPKSRNRAVLDKHFQKMYELCDTKGIESYLSEKDKEVLYFEMYGMKNRHFIQHMDTYIDLRLIGIYNLIYGFKNCFTFYNFLKRPDSVFNIWKDEEEDDVWRFDLVKYQPYANSGWDYCSKDKLIRKMQETLAEVNKNYEKENGRLAIEGVVIHCEDKNGNYSYIKVKPSDLQERAKAEGKKGVPKRHIKKEMFKFFDEYESEAEEYYLNNQEFIISYVKKQLLEEFSQMMVDYHSMDNKIINVFLEVAKERTVSDSVNNIANKLVSEYPELEVPDLMRKFAQDYPFLKKSDSSDMYNVLCKLKK